MHIHRPLPLLGGLSPARFMRTHWQKKPLLVRQAVPDMVPPIARAALFELAGAADVESRLVRRAADGWTLRSGPFARRALPGLQTPGWTLLVQGVDLHHAGVHALLQQFRFVPDARLDDLMISYASEGGGVGPHFDSYDVFLLQAQGRRRWSIGRQKDLALQPGMPLKILRHFEPEQSFELAPGDMLYLPPRYAHDGVALGPDCMTFSIGLRAPSAAQLGADLLARMAEAAGDEAADATAAAQDLYRDPRQPAVRSPGAMPAALQQFARQAVARALRQPGAVERALGESLTEPKAHVWFEPGRAPQADEAVTLDRRSRALYDRRHFFLNGESFRAAGRDAALMRQLADRRALAAHELRAASPDAQALVDEWCEAGWLRAG